MKTIMQIIKDADLQFPIRVRALMNVGALDSSTPIASGETFIIEGIAPGGQYNSSYHGRQVMLYRKRTTTQNYRLIPPEAAFEEFAGAASLNETIDEELYQAGCSSNLIKAMHAIADRIVKEAIKKGTEPTEAQKKIAKDKKEAA